MDTAAAIELVEGVLAGRSLHSGQSVGELAKGAAQFMVLSQNILDRKEFWVDGFSDDIEGALRFVNGIDDDWTLAGVYDLLAILLGHGGRVDVKRGARALNMEVWEN